MTASDLFAEPRDPTPEDSSAGPDTSMASLSAALDIERANVVQLSQLSEHQRRLLGRRAVRVALKIDRGIRRVQTSVTNRAKSLTGRTSQVGLAALALRHRGEIPDRRRALDEALEQVPEPAHDDRTITLLVLVGEEPGVIPPHDPARVDVLVILTHASATVPSGFTGRHVTAAHKTAAAAVRDAARAARGELLCITWATSDPLDDRWLDHLAAEITGDAVAAAPMTIHPARKGRRATPHDVRIRSLGIDVISHRGRVSDVRAYAAGEAPDPRASAVVVAAGTSVGFMIRRDVYREAGGLAQFVDLDTALIDLCGRIRAGGGRVVGVPAAVVVDHRRVQSIRSLTRPVPGAKFTWGPVVERREPSHSRATVRRLTTSHLLIRMTVAAPSARVAPRWGDWHLADGLARSLRRLGHSVHMQTLGDLGSPTGDRTGDVHIVLRGAARVPMSPGECRVLWIISHPETIDISECDESSLVLVASEAFAAELRTRTDTPVEVLLQATDDRRFAPVTPSQEHAHAVAVVAMTRHVFRPSVRMALAAGLRPAIYGSDWTEFVDPKLVIAEFVPNENLPVIYSSVGVLLNDHWDTMRAWGFVSNRIYDGLGCATPIISDHLPQIAELFGDAVATFGDSDDLRTAVDEALDDPLSARRRAQEGREIVLAHHTFGHRADELLALMEAHGIVRLTT